VIRFSVPKVNTGMTGYRTLTRLQLLIDGTFDQHVILDFGACGWFDAGVCAPLGALLARFRSEGGVVEVEGLSDQLRPLFERNRFAQFLGLPGGAFDGYNTAISFSHFGPASDVAFKDYLLDELRGKALPQMTAALASRFRESLSEVFDNAITHASSAAGITACGQLFPAQNLLRFSISDGGIGFAGSVLRRLGLHMRSEQAIVWAMTGTNTTRTQAEGVPGGLGLKEIVLKLIELNRGTLRIVSGDGYWQNVAGVVSSGPLQNQFPGTSVDIEINTADTNSYCLSSEIDPLDIF
jgi:hypothetical protein